MVKSQSQGKLTRALLRIVVASVMTQVLFICPIRHLELLAFECFYGIRELYSAVM